LRKEWILSKCHKSSMQRAANKKWPDKVPGWSQGWNLQNARHDSGRIQSRDLDKNRRPRTFGRPITGPEDTPPATIVISYTANPVERIRRLSAIFGDSIRSRIAFLGQMRPSPGSPQTADTRGIDVLIILFRLLTTYGWGFDSDYDSDIDSHLTSAEKAFQLNSQLNIGWNREEDWHLKEMILEALCPGKKKQVLGKS